MGRFHYVKLDASNRVVSKRSYGSKINIDGFISVSQTEYLTLQTSDVFDAETGDISRYTPSVNHRNIRAMAFRDRFLPSEKVAIKQSMDHTISVMEDEVMSKIAAGEHIDLDSELVIMGFDALITAGVVDSARATVLRQDATSEEVWQS